MNTKLALSTVGLLGPALWAGCDRAAPRAARGAVTPDRPGPNVVLISIDMLRPDHLGCYGYPRDTSPRIDRLASEGALFETAVSSSSWTLPAHAALMTGLVDSVHGCVDTDRPLSARHATLAERLRAAGYEAAGFFSGPYLHPVFGLAQGFDPYVDCSSYAKLNSETAQRTGRVEGLAIWRSSHRDVTSPRVYEAVHDWLRRKHGRPFFLFVHMWDVHYDFLPPPPYDRMFDPDYEGPITGESFLFNQWINARMPARDLEHLIALYDAEIAWTDRHVGLILDALDALGLRESTLVIVLADHGTEFFEHGDKSHRKSLFDEAIRIPLVIRCPDGLSAGRRIDGQVSIIDVLPTVLELVSAPAPDDVMGHSLVPLLRGRSAARERIAVSELFSNGRHLRSFRCVDHKIIHDFLTGRDWIYDLAHDPGEQCPVFDPASDLVREAGRSARLGEQWLAAFSNRRAPLDEASGRVIPPAAVPRSVLRNLESLGYIGPADE